MKNISIIFVLGILLVSLCSFGCPKQEEKPPITEIPTNTSGTGTTVNTTNTTTPATPLELCQNKQNILEKDACLKDLAVSEADKGICEKIYSSETKDDCIYSFIGQGVAVCDELSDLKKKDTCLDFNARNTKNLSLCDRIGDADTRSACVNVVSPPCLAIVDTKERSKCMAIAEKNPAECSGDDDCLFEYGTALNDTTACDNISLKSKRSACRSFSTGSVTCDSELTLAPDIGYCFELVAIKANDSYYCGRIAKSSSYSAECFTALAIQEKDAGVCKGPALEDDQNNCLLAYAIATGEYQWCSNITYYMSSMRKDNCYRQTAVKYNNPMICDGIPIGAERTSCYGIVLSSDLPYDPATCSGISDSAWKDTCYYRVAVQKGDNSYCDKINSPTTKMNCKDKFIS